MQLNEQRPWTTEEIRLRIQELQVRIERCRKELEIAESEVELLADRLAEPTGERVSPPVLAGRLAGM